MKWILIGILLIILTNNAYAIELPFRSRPGNAGIPGEWLAAFVTSARHAGMGGIGAGLGDAASVFTNPSELLEMTTGEIQFLVAPLFSGARSQSLSVAYPKSRKEGWGMTVSQLESGEAEQTNNLGQNVGSIEDKKLAVSTSYGRRLFLDIASGVSLKLVNQNFSGHSATGLGVDMGFNVHPKNTPFGLGLAIQNIIPPRLKLVSETEEIKPVLRGSASYQGETKNVPYRVVGEGLWLKSGSAKKVVRWGIGTEGEFLKNSSWPLFLRLGVNHREYTFGLGVEKGPFRLDYATAIHELGLLHRFGFTLKYGLLPPFSERQIKSEWEKLSDKEKELREKEYELTMKAKAEPQQKENIQMELMLVKARKYYLSKKYKKATNLLNQLRPTLKDLGNKEEVKILLAMCWAHVFIEDGIFAQAKEQLIKVVELDPTHEEATILYKRLLNVINVAEGNEEKK